MEGVKSGLSHPRFASSGQRAQLAFSHGNNEAKVEYMMRLVAWSEFLDKAKLWICTVVLAAC